MSTETIKRTIGQLEREYIETEAWLLSCILFDSRTLTGLYGQPGIQELITPECFYDVKHQQIYEAALSLSKRGIDATCITVYAEMEALHTADVGDVTILDKLLGRIATPEGVLADDLRAYYSIARIVYENWGKRRTYKITGDIANAAKNHDLAAIEKLQVELDQAVHIGAKDGQGLTTEDADDITDTLIEWYEDPREIRGYRTGIDELDYHLGGLHESELVFLAGYTGSGKSTMVTQFALSFCEQGAGLIVPTEMTVAQYKLRMVAYLLGSDDETLRKGQYRDKTAILEASHYVNNLPISWFKGSAPTPSQILTSARNLYRNGLAEWVIIDGLHDIKVENAEIYERTNAAVDALHQIALCGLRVVATAHLNRGATDEPNPRDMLGSARIEQVATRILTLYRPGNLMESGEMKTTPNGYSPNYAQVRLAKSRFSKAGHVVKLFFGKRDGRHAFFPAVEDKPAHINLTAYKED